MKLYARTTPSNRPHYAIELDFQQVVARCTRLLNESKTRDASRENLTTENPNPNDLTLPLPPADFR